ncbi:hypothetical protein [Microbacterium soli]|uniref:Uncharacterized protein n=1 Tax=Microbacterium soli TaxID=446075 RepID=A0ABP7NLU2_9MICO
MNAETTPVAVVLETREGVPHLGGRRRLVDDFTDAADVVDEFDDGKVFAIEEVVTDPPFPPVDAMTGPVPALLPGSRIVFSGWGLVATITGVTALGALIFGATL